MTNHKLVVFGVDKGIRQNAWYKKIARIWPLSNPPLTRFYPRSYDDGRYVPRPFSDEMYRDHRDMMFAPRDYPPFDHRPLDPGPRSRDSSRPSSVGREDRIPPVLFPRDLPLRDLPPRDLPPRDYPPRDIPPRDFFPPQDAGPLLPSRDIPRVPSRDGKGSLPPPAIPSRNSNGRTDSGDLSRSGSNTNLNKINSSSSVSLGIWFWLTVAVKDSCFAFGD